MNDATRWLVLVVLVGGIVAAFYYYWQQNVQQPPPLVEAPSPQAEIQPAIRHPIQPAGEASPLPPLDDSDAATRARPPASGLR